MEWPSFTQAVFQPAAGFRFFGPIFIAYSRLKPIFFGMIKLTKIPFCRFLNFFPTPNTKKVMKISVMWSQICQRTQQQ